MADRFGLPLRLPRSAWAFDRGKTGRRSRTHRNIPVRVVFTPDGGLEDSGPLSVFRTGVSVLVELNIWDQVDPLRWRPFWFTPPGAPEII
jgi:hypothetical protein